MFIELSSLGESKRSLNKLTAAQPLEDLYSSYKIIFFCSDCSHSCSHCDDLVMRQPWNCPYCSHKSMRNWNLGVHIDRIHKGEFNPCHKKRGITFYDSTRKLGINSKSLLPNFEANGPIEPSVQLQNLLEQIKGLSRLELVFLMCAINNHLNS